MNTLSLAYVAGLYDEFLADPETSDPAWRPFFESLGNGQTLESLEEFLKNAPIAPRLNGTSNGEPGVLLTGNASATNGKSSRPIAHLSTSQLQDRVAQLIREYRERGHLLARLDPLGIPRVSYATEMAPEFYDISKEMLEESFAAPGQAGRQESLKLKDILKRLENTYCRSIGVQFTHIDDFAIRHWLQQRMERSENRLALDKETQVRILARLIDAITFEEYLRKKFQGAKTFSLEGAESLIPLLHLALEKAGSQDIKECVLAMAHRGRLNVLANILGKRAKNIFWEFEDPNPEAHRGRGDVRYHLGYSGNWRTSEGKNMHLSLCFNPSHLEFVNPVALGRVRSKQDRIHDENRHQVMTIMIHGDAAFAGEGVVQETLNMSRLNGYEVGGTLHVIINNQIGFTTPPEQGRSSRYATDVAKLLQVPIFHVNGEDPEAVAHVVNLAMEFRHFFHRDVVIDMYCYRRWGHNEADEPRYTQPVMYQIINRRETVRDSYQRQVLKLGGITEEEADKIAEDRRTKLEQELEAARKEDFHEDRQALQGYWNGYVGDHEPKDDDPDTSLSRERICDLLTRSVEKPEKFKVLPKLERFIKQRLEMANGKRPLDWAAGEAAALCSLLMEGHPIRLTGQDTGRGTFTHRHAEFHHADTGIIYVPMQNLSPEQAPFTVINSPLCETGTLGFEYGYSLDYPEALVAWEAQFGDFWNAAQVIVDQFITSAEDKWNRLSGLVMLLPHGFEGQGPEHSSARIERLLLLTAEDNIQILYPTTPAQYYHCLRRQVIRRWRKPLIIFTPKSLLRHPKAVSEMEDLTEGHFQRIIPDENPERKNVKRLLLCMGKLYYELLDYREENNRDDVAIVRMEQLYPLPIDSLTEVLSAYADETPTYWVQEEPSNMGASQFIKVKYGNRLLDRFPLEHISRPESASPSTGSARTHKLEQQELVERAFGDR
ncbi:Alpha-ketoglutarate decarboxylase [Planctomycetales bacterium 10988]|nr:Alpha-ketoglutarate decarboxylase [Planctomycetales bacterium 10988]